jgi:hypothetical protein
MQGLKRLGRSEPQAVSDPLTVVGPANDPDERRQQDLVQSIGRDPRNSMARDDPHMIQKSEADGRASPAPFESTFVNQSLAIEDSALLSSVRSDLLTGPRRSLLRKPAARST